MSVSSSIMMSHTSLPTHLLLLKPLATGHAPTSCYWLCQSVILSQFLFVCVYECVSLTCVTRRAAQSSAAQRSAAQHSASARTCTHILSTAHSFSQTAAALCVCTSGGVPGCVWQCVPGDVCFAAFHAQPVGCLLRWSVRGHSREAREAQRWFFSLGGHLFRCAARGEAGSNECEITGTWYGGVGVMLVEEER